MSRKVPDVVISGIAGRFPASDSVEELKHNLYSGVDMVIPDNSRWPVGLWGLPPCSGKVKSFDKFDADFFGYTPKEVEYLDPQERKLLETTYEAIVDAGVDPRSLIGTNVGVFQGSCFQEFHKDFKDASAKSKYIPNQVTTLSRHFRLKGPVMHVDTACGSSFCALNEAFRALKNGMCEQAIVTGSNTVFQPIFSYEMLDLHMISKDGKSKCMDASANGYARAEAVVVVFLQKFQDAKRVYATILNSKANADGWKAEGVTFPGQEGQAKLLRETYEEIGLNPLDFKYIEAHTTGTTAGDPVELNAIHDVLCANRTVDNSLLVGCIKSRIGHSEGASGLCALVKSLLVLQNKRIPPNLHLTNPNLNIKGLVDGTMTPVNEILPFDGDTIPVNCFGFGGANVHIVIKSLERLLSVESFNVSDSFPRIVNVCGRTAESVNFMFEGITNGEKTLTREFLSLVNDFSKTNPEEGMLYRGYMIVDGKLGDHSFARSTPQLVGKRKLHLLLADPEVKSSFGMSLMSIPSFANQIKRINRYMSAHNVDLLKCIGKANLSEKESFALNISATLAMVEIIKTLKVHVDGIVGSGVSELVCAYFKGQLTIEQVVHSSFSAASFEQERDNLVISPKHVIASSAARSSKWQKLVLSCVSPRSTSEHFFQHFVESQVPKIPDDGIALELGAWGLRERHSSSLNCCNETLHTIGKLYAAGHNPDIASLYPSVQFPLPTWVPTLSSLIKWDHNKTYSLGTRLIELDSKNNAVLSKIIPFHFDRQNPEDNFFFDHKIDGRVLFPATGYLAMSWFALSKMRSVPFFRCPVKFNDVKIERATVLLPSKKTSFQVRMNEDTGTFEVREGEIVVVSGKIKMTTEHENLMATSKNNVTVLDSIDIYKELRVRGYDYDPFFQGMFRAATDGTEATIIWRDVVPKNVKETLSLSNEDDHIMLWLRSWIMFCDSVIQLTLLDEENTGRALFVPTKLESLECSPLVFKQAVEDGESINDPLTLNQSKLINCVYNRHDGVVQTPGLVLKGLKTSLLKRNPQIVRRKKFEFVPLNETDTFDDITQKNKIRNYHQQCVQLARKVNAGNHNIDTELSLDLNDSRHALLRKLRNKINDEETVVDCKDDILIGRLQDEMYFQDRFLKPFFDLITYNTIYSAKHTSLDVLEVSSNSAFNLSKKFTYLMEESLFSDQTSINYSMLLTSSQSECIPSGVTKIVNWNEDNEAMIPNSHLIVFKDFTTRDTNQSKLFRGLFNATREGGFLLAFFREELPSSDINTALRNLNIAESNYHTREQIVNHATSAGYKFIGEKSLLRDVLPLSVALFRKQRLDFDADNQILIEVGINNYDSWLEYLKLLIKRSSDDDDRRIWLVPRHDEPVSKKRFTGLFGFVKSLRLEPGGDRVRCLIDWTTTKRINLASYLEILKHDLVFNVMQETSVGWGTYEHLFVSEHHQEEDLRKSKHLYLKSLKPGDLSSLVWSESNFAQDPTKKIIDVCYAPLNFKDIVYASGKLALDSVHDIDPLVAQDSLLGMEFAGKDANGNRVMGVLPYKALATTVAIDENSFMLPIPANWTLEEAATVPVVYSTAFYGLVVRGQLREGESVLIHSGAGGVGLAAINICLGKHCTVYTTVGTKEKKDFLLREFPTLPRDHIFNSRDTKFEEDIFRITDGKGVDVVLNSLSGEKLQASLRCVADGGRFLEIGKVDLLQDSSLFSWQLGGNRTMHGVYPESFFRFNSKKEFYFPNRMVEERKQLQLLIIQGMKDGIVRPLHRTVFEMNKVEDAFRFMSSGKHIGKVLIQIRNDERPHEEPHLKLRPESVTKSTFFYPSKSYIVVGGLGGFGLEVVQWMADKGARKIVVNSRRGARGSYHKYCLERLEKNGVQVILSQDDSITESGITSLVQRASELGPVGAVFNTAAVFNDVLYDDQTITTFDSVCAPKVKATLHLDKITRKMCPSLDYFVAFSSISAGRGNPGQTNYNFANSIMDSICEERRKDGLHGLSIQWGVIGDVGYVAEMANSNGTVILGLTSQRMHSCLAYLDTFLQAKDPIVCCYVKADKQSSDEISDTTDILKLVSRILGLKDINAIDQTTTLGSLGIDSLIAVEIQQIIERVQGTQVPLKKVKELTIGQFIDMTKSSKELKGG